MSLSKVFLSHSSADKAFVDRLASDLERINVSVWYAKWEIRVGDSLIEKIQQGIESNDYLAIILSPHSTKSEWVKKEVNAGLMRELDEKKVFLLPLLIADCKIPTFLKEKKYADFRNSYEEGFEEFLFTVSPENKITISRSKDFRSTQYLLSGLTSSDSSGTNTLNFSQLRKIYPYRRELQTFLDNEQNRLLLWSALAFEYANPHKPFFMSITTPVWGLLSNTDSKHLASWIIDGLQGGTLFDYLIPYYSWAKEILGNVPPIQLWIGLHNRTKLNSDFLAPLGKTNSRSMQYALKAFAEDDQDAFDQRFITLIDKGAPNAPLIIESTAHLSSPLTDDFYFRFMDSPRELFFAAFNALAELRRPVAITFLKNYLHKVNKPDETLLDQAFMKLGYPEFIPDLHAWLDDNLPIDLQVRILVSLSNANVTDRDRTLWVIDQIFKTKDKSVFLPTAVKIYGRCGIDREDHLNRWIAKWSKPIDPIHSESAIFALGRIAGRTSQATLSKLLTSESETVLAATIETMAKYIGLDSYAMLKNLSKHSSPLVQSAFYRALSHIRPSDWQSYLPLAKDQTPLVRLCAARVFAQLASPAMLKEWLDDPDTDEFLKVTADEILFAPRAFASKWITHPEQFDPELVGLPVRLTNFDADEIWLNTDFDLNRGAYFFVYGANK